MPNKRITELNQIISAELQPDDLFLLVDIEPSPESKKLNISDLADYIRSNGSSSYVIQSLSSSYALRTLSSSYALSASYVPITPSISASYALSASYSLLSNITSAVSSSYAITSSYSLDAYSSSFSYFAKSASFLIYLPGQINGTASFALNSISSSYALNVFPPRSSSYALTSSYSVTPGLITGSAYLITSSWAISSSFIESASYALTASYAASFTIPLSINKSYGIVSALTRSYVSASIDYVNVSPSNQIACTSSIEAWGTAIVPYTASATQNNSIALIALDRWAGITQSLDSTPLNVNIGGATVSGSLHIPFSLAGNGIFTGSYSLYITASTSIGLITTRIPRFNIVSTSDGVTFGAGEDLVLTTALPSDLLTFTSLDGGPFIDTAAHIVQTGSNRILTMNASSASGIRYVWSLPNLTSFSCSGTGIVDIGGMPNSIVTMSVNNNLLNRLAPLNYTSISILSCSNNALTYLPELPATMSYIDCSINYITRLPTRLPYGLTIFNCESNYLSQIPSIFPDSLISMSFGSNSSLIYWTSTLPNGALKYFDIGNCQLIDTSIDNICNGLVNNAVSNGYLNLIGNPSIAISPLSASSIEPNVNTLRTTYAWTVLI